MSAQGAGGAVSGKRRDKVMSIEPEELIEILKHWKNAREKYLNSVEVAENLRCVVDIAGLLSEHGYAVPPELRKHP